MRFKPWTVEEYTILFEFCEEKGPAFCLEVLKARGFDRTESAVNNACRAAGLKYKGSKLGCFKPGHAPANKGKKMAPEVKESVKHTFFKKGERRGAANNNYVPIGHETIRADGYTWVKIAEKTWEQKHRLIYQEHRGPIPKGQLVIFKDGNPLNLAIDNLELISRKELVVRNRWGSGPSEYSLISGRAAIARLNKRGIGDRIARQTPGLLEMAQAETLLKLQSRKRNDRT